METVDIDKSSQKFSYESQEDDGVMLGVFKGALVVELEKIKHVPVLMEQTT